MAVVSREGSHLVRKHREQKERKRAQNKDWELAGSKMGNVLGIVEEKEPEEDEDENYNAKAGSQFKEHMNVEQEGGATAFSRLVFFSLKFAQNSP